MGRLLAPGPPLFLSPPSIPWPPPSLAGALTAAVPFARDTATGHHPSPIRGNLYPPSPTQRGTVTGLQGMNTVTILSIVMVTGAISLMFCYGLMSKDGPAARAAEAAERRRLRRLEAAAARGLPCTGQKSKAGLADSIRESYPTFIYSKTMSLQPTLTEPPPPASDCEGPAGAPALRADTRPVPDFERAPASEASAPTGAGAGACAASPAAADSRASFIKENQGDPEPLTLPESFPAGAPQTAPALQPPAGCHGPDRDTEVPLGSSGRIELLTDSCAVCLAEFEEGDVLLGLPCQHAFHTGCVEAWLRGHVTCPVCRRLLQEGSRHGPAAEGQRQPTRQLAGAPGAGGAGPQELASQVAPGQGEGQGERQGEVQGGETLVSIEDSTGRATNPGAQARPLGLLATAWQQVMGQQR